jgi:hypothetical protein
MIEHVLDQARQKNAVSDAAVFCFLRAVVPSILTLRVG